MNNKRSLFLIVVVGVASVLLPWSISNSSEPLLMSQILDLTPTAYSYLPLVLKDCSLICTPVDWYRDADNDGYGNSSDSLAACNQPFGYVADNSDCNDGNADVNPGATEVCNGTDDDCNPITTDGWDEAWLGQDCDGADSDLCQEGVFQCVAGSQTCSDETNNTVEICGNSIDDDCDGETDEPDCS